MYNVGGQQGNVYTNDQGKGLATTIDTTSEEAVLLKLASDKIQKQKEENDGLNKAMTRISEKSPEFFYVFDQEMSKTKDTLTDELTTAVANGEIKGDVFSSTSPKAIEWRKKWDKFGQDAASTMQYKTWYEKTIQDINVNPDKYDPKSVSEAVNFLYDTPFEELIQGKKPLPTLRTKEPVANTFEAASKIDKIWKDANKGMLPPTVDQLVPLVFNYLQSPTSAIEAKSYAERYYSMKPADQAVYENIAIKSGFGKEAALAAFVAQEVSLINTPQPYDVTGTVAEALKEIETETSSRASSDGSVSSSTVQERIANPALPKTKAEYLVNRDFPHMMQDQNFVQDAGITEKDTTEQAKVKAIKYLETQIRESKGLKSSKETSVTLDAQQKKQRNLGMSEFLTEIRSASGIAQRDRLANLKGKGGNVWKGFTIGDGVTAMNPDGTVRGLVYLELKPDKALDNAELGKLPKVPGVLGFDTKAPEGRPFIGKAAAGDKETIYVAINVNEPNSASMLLRANFGDEAWESYDGAIAGDKTPKVSAAADALK
jgi:hypothetical protein